MVDAEHQHHQGRGDDVVEVQADAAADVDADEGDRGVGGQDEHQRSEQLAVPVELRYRQEDQRGHHVDPSDPLGLLDDQELLDAEQHTDRGPDSRCEREDAQLPRRDLEIVLGAALGVGVHGDGGHTRRPSQGQPLGDRRSATRVELHR